MYTQEEMQKKFQQFCMARYTAQSQAYQTKNLTDAVLYSTCVDLRQNKCTSNLSNCQLLQQPSEQLAACTRLSYTHMCSHS
jgi:hypothetical protein